MSRSDRYPAPHLAVEEDEISALWRLTRSQRIAAMRRGMLSFGQLIEWTRHRPDEVPLVHGEFEWIVLSTPEFLEHDEPAAATRVIAARAR